jgi:hypothetical protein
MFSKRIFSKSNKIHISCEEPSKQDNLCSICLDGFVCSKHTLTTPCGHQFHTLCFAQAAQHKQSCPNCRTQIEHVTIYIKPTLSQRMAQLEKKCNKTIHYLFEHHFMITLVFSVPIGYTCIIGYIVYSVCKYITYPIWKPFTVVQPEIEYE